MPLSATKCLLIAVVVALGASGCGSGDGSEPQPPPKWEHETTRIDDARTAASVVRHQQEDHCAPRRLLEARCTDAGDVWRCEFETDRGRGQAEIEKDFGPGGESVTC